MTLKMSSKTSVQRKKAEASIYWALGRGKVFLEWAARKSMITQLRLQGGRVPTTPFCVAHTIIFATSLSKLNVRLYVGPADILITWVPVSHKHRMFAPSRSPLNLPPFSIADSRNIFFVCVCVCEKHTHYSHWCKLPLYQVCIQLNTQPFFHIPSFLC